MILHRHSIKTLATYSSLSNSTSLVTMYIPGTTKVTDVTNDQLRDYQSFKY